VVVTDDEQLMDFASAYHEMMSAIDRLRLIEMSPDERLLIDEALGILISIQAGVMKNE